MQMQVRIPVGVCDFPVIDLAQPVISGDRTAVGKDQPADGVRDGGIFLYPPVGNVDIAVYEVLIVQESTVQIADLFPLFPV